MQQRAKLRQNGAELMRLQAQNHEVLRREIGQIVAGLHLDTNPLLRVFQTQPGALNRLQMRATRQHADRVSGCRKPNGQRTAHGARANNQNFPGGCHALAPHSTFSRAQIDNSPTTIARKKHLPC